MGTVCAEVLRHKTLHLISQHSPVSGGNLSHFHSVLLPVGHKLSLLHIFLIQSMFKYLDSSSCLR